MSDDDAIPPGPDPQGSGRRQGDRRKAQAPFAGEDRRKTERRSGADRRAAPRSEGMD